MSASGSPSTGDWALYRRLLRYLKGQWLLFFVAVIGFLLAAGAEAFFAQVLGQVVDSFDTDSDLSIWYFPSLIVLAALVRACGSITGELLLSRISFRVVHVLRCELFDRLLVVPSEFFEASAQGQIVSRLTFTTAQLRDTATDALKIIFQDGGKLVVLLAFMFWHNRLLTAIFLLVTPLVGGVVRFASKRFRRISERIQSSMGDVTHVVSEAVSGYRVMRAFGGEKYERGRFLLASDRNRRQNLKMVATKASSAQLIQVFVAVSIGGLIGLVFQPDIVGAMTRGELITYIGLAGLLASPIKRLSDVNARLQRGLAAASDVFSQIDEDAERNEGTHEGDRVTGKVEFRNVSFRYSAGEHDALSDIDITIQPGQTVALVGRSGGGKSTLVSLIARFYEPTDGEISLDGVPVTQYKLGNLRQQIALVSQEVVLFNDTLRANVAYGSLGDASDEDIFEALGRANAEEFVRSLPNGLDTELGDNGVLLSGGQRQRIAIARAFLKNAPLLILDEATSDLDTESERLIQNALNEVMRDRTTVVIAHRLSTIEKADVIYVLDGGAIVQQGSHDELVGQDGPYSVLYRSQFEDDDGVTNKVTEGPTSIEVDLDSHEARGSILVRAWYNNSFWPRVLQPFAALFGWIVRKRRSRYVTGWSSSWRAPVPVVVVGNINVGGTGKTPLVIWLSKWLMAGGKRVGIVSRGYGGKARFPLRVNNDSSAEDAGDEAPMLAARTGCPVVVDPDRVRAVKNLLSVNQIDVVISDDGLQHYALERDIEIAVVDGNRGLGNGRLLPAGPLREPASRLTEVDWVVANGRATGLVEGESVMKAVATAFVNLRSHERVSPQKFAERIHGPLYAIAGVGNPARFAYSLIGLGLDPVVRAFPDHHSFSVGDLSVPAHATVVVTEKDAGKVRVMDQLPNEVWYLEIEVVLNDEDERRIAEVFERHGISIETVS